ncbi:MAG: glycosyltransferase family 2 protein [Planctomycetota bacterium]|nr:glycosyltransferase family 2 protein [Planctomycetota bacterium]
MPHAPSSSDSDVTPDAGVDAPVPDLSIIIVNWNARDLLRDCLDSIEANRGALGLELIVVDNASTDGSAAMIAREFPSVHLIANGRNAGFAAANNQGLRAARGRFLLLLNPDTVVLDDALTRALRRAEADPTIGILGCQARTAPEVIQRTCFRFPSPLTTLLWVSGLSSRFPRAPLLGWATYGPWDRRSEREVDVVSGMFMLVRREALEEVGLMDEAFFLYAEEADWCRRFRDAGRRCVLTPEACILHVHGGGNSTEQIGAHADVHKQQGTLQYHRKHRSFAAWLTTKMLFAVSSVLRTLWWSLWSALRIGRLSRAKAAQSARAMRFHWLNAET